MAKADTKGGGKSRRRLRVPSDDVPRPDTLEARGGIDISDVRPLDMAESSSDNAIPITTDEWEETEEGAEAADTTVSANDEEAAPESAAPESAGGDSGRSMTVALSDTDLEEVTDVQTPAPVAGEAAQPAPRDMAAKTLEMPTVDPGGAKKGPPPAPIGKAPSAAVTLPRGWYDDIFDEDYLRTLPFLTPKATQAEANFVIDALELSESSQVLDVACGYGRHAMELAARGFQVVGLDNSLPLLLRGAEEAQRRGLTIHFVHGDMRQISFEAQFDGAYCLFNSFGYFDDEANRKTLSNIARAMKPGGRFVIEVLNRDYLTVDLPSRVWWEGDGCVVLEEVEFNYYSSRVVSSRSLVFDDGRQLEQEISIRVYSLHELGKLLHAVGFRVVEISGSMATRGRFFGAQSRDLVVVAERR